MSVLFYEEHSCFGFTAHFSLFAGVVCTVSWCGKSLWMWREWQKCCTLSFDEWLSDHQDVSVVRTYCSKYPFLMSEVSVWSVQSEYIMHMDVLYVCVCCVSMHVHTRKCLPLLVYIDYYSRTLSFFFTGMESHQPLSVAHQSRERTTVSIIISDTHTQLKKNCQLH